MAQQPPRQKQLVINYPKPVVASDGHTVFISEQGPVTIVFFQARGETPDAVLADAVAAVRLHSLEELEAFKKGIGDAIKTHRTREP